MSVDKWDRAKPVMTVRRRRDRDDRRREAEDTMTIDHDRFAEANQPPPERVTETPEVEASPEEGKPPLDAVANVEGVAVACRLEEGTMQVTVLLPGRIESISTSIRVPFFDVAPAPESDGGSYSNELPPRPSA